MSARVGATDARTHPRVELTVMSVCGVLICANGVAPIRTTQEL
jgi:hypothetical protein